MSKGAMKREYSIKLSREEVEWLAGVLESLLPMAEQQVRLSETTNDFEFRRSAASRLSVMTELRRRLPVPGEMTMRQALRRLRALPLLPMKLEAEPGGSFVFHNEHGGYRGATLAELVEVAERDLAEFLAERR